MFFLRPRDYSKSVAIAPFIVNYSGALFREFPGPWQVRGRAFLVCVFACVFVAVCVPLVAKHN